MSQPRRPVAVLELPLEGRMRVFLLAESEEDLRRLRAWVRHSSEARGLDTLLREALAVLDRGENEAA